MSDRPRLLDLFCGAGGASMGYYRAGFDVVGVDIKPQKRYPFEFILGDALEFCATHGREFDVIHASPPCQAYSMTRRLKTSRIDHVDLVAKTRALLIEANRLYVIENVPGAPLVNPLMLCGSMFGLTTIRHRLFECNPVIWFPPMSCRHGRRMPMWWKSRRTALKAGRTFEFITVVGKSFLMSEAKRAMDIDWMVRDEISQAVPPAYTKFIGHQLMTALGR